MGAWGHGIRQDDFVCDVIDAFKDLLKAGNSVADATKAVKSKFSAEIKDGDDGPLFWIALADAQWTYGALEPQVFERIKEDFCAGRGLTLWSENSRALSRRRAALEKFIDKIAGPNPRPKKPPKVVIRAPKFRPGECLSIRLANGQYAAALVLAADHSNAEHGTNLIGVLDYLAPEKPTLEVFRKRNWLVSHHTWNNVTVEVMDLAWYVTAGFRAAKDRLEIVGQVEILDSDPKDSKTFSSNWGGLGEKVVSQREQDAKGT
jgi:hypothetical protein